MLANFPFPIEQFSFGALKLACLSEGGPRIIGLSYKGSANLLAEQAEKVEETSFGLYHFVGGHRFWAAPEIKPETYYPDHYSLELENDVDGLRLKGAVNPLNGLQKEILISQGPAENSLSLTHTMVNLGEKSVTVAPWALTMLKPGGRAWFPTGDLRPDPDGLLPNRFISFWPYNRANEPRVQINADHLLIDMRQPDPAPGKWGTYNARGWMAYQVDGLLFLKRFRPAGGRNYPDFGSNAETYICDQFIELETLGQVKTLQPGETTTLKEIWSVFEKTESIQSFEDVEPFIC